MSFLWVMIVMSFSSNGLVTGEVILCDLGKEPLSSLSPDGVLHVLGLLL